MATPKTLSDTETKKIAEAHSRGEPLPAGVTFAPYNNPPYMASAEYEKQQEELA